MVKTYDYDVLYSTFSSIITSTQNLTMIELGGAGKIPPAPFVVFDIISPHINIYEHYDVTERVPFEAVVSFTHYALSKVSALSLAENLRMQLTADAVQKTMRDNEIVVVEIMPTQIRSIQDPTADKFMAGFDVRLRLREPYVDETLGVIEDIQYKEIGD